MRCEFCPTCGTDIGEHDATECWCNIGENNESYYYNDYGCRRRSLDKIKRDLKIANEIDSKEFAEECESFLKSMEENKNVD